MNKELHPRSDADRLYVSRTEGGRRLIECKMCVKAEENSFRWYVILYIKPLIIAIRISNNVPSENSAQSKEFKKQYSEERLNNWKGKVMYEQYLRPIGKKNKINTWKWLRKSKLKGCAKALL